MKLFHGWAPRKGPGRNGVFKPTVVIDGKVRGTWSSKSKAKAMTIELQPFKTFTTTERKSVAAFAERYSEHHALAVTVL